MLFLRCRKDTDPIPQVPLVNYSAIDIDPKFGQSGNHLFIISGKSIGAYDISNPQNPIFLGLTQLTYYPLSILCKGDTLFANFDYGVKIYDASNPANLNLLISSNVKFYSHPIVASGSYDFITLHTYIDEEYNGYGPTYFLAGLNQLWAFNINNLSLTNPVDTLHMQYPQGLAISNNMLYVCDSGLRVFDVSNMPSIISKKVFRFNYNPSNVINYNSTNLVLAADSGIYQYHYDLDTTLSFLSKVKVNPIK